MKSNLGILSSDALNRDGYIILFEALEKSVSKVALKGMPSLIEHDFHRPIGWIYPFGLFIEPKITKTIGNFFLSETNEDQKIISKKVQNYYNYTNHEECAEFIEEFSNLLGEHYSTKGRFMFRACACYVYPDIVSKIFPKLFQNEDKSGLVYVDEILKDFTYVGHGIFKHNGTEFCICCHQYFNRNLSLFNNFNTYFIDEFLNLQSNSNLKLRLAIDKNLIGFAKSIKGVLEFDYWWGPKFDDDISNLPNEVTRYESNETQKFYNNVKGTEFWWKTNDKSRVLEIEEIRERPSLGVSEEQYGCRYIHSIYDMDKKEFEHFDGAIRMYSEEQILERWEKSINKSGKDTEYTKLFRIDGKLELADWKKLCILYYKGNPLIYEYFGVKEEYEALNDHEPTNDPLAECLPNKITEQDGVRLFVSYHSKKQDYSSFERKIIHPDVISFEDETVLTVVEYDIVEIKKYLERHGGSLEFPEGIQFVKPFDLITNYPIILHGSQNANKLLAETLEAFRNILAIRSEKVIGTIVFTLAWEMQEFETRLSIFGTSSEILKWLDQADIIPTENEDFRIWITKQKDFLYSEYSYVGKDLNHLLRNDGIFYLKRKHIDPKYVKFEERTEGLYYETAIPDHPELMDLLEQGMIAPSQVALIKKATCSKTGENYFTSSTSKYLDEDVQMLIHEIEPLGFFWMEPIS